MERMGLWMYEYKFVPISESITKRDCPSDDGSAKLP